MKLKLLSNRKKDGAAGSVEAGYDSDGAPPSTLGTTERLSWRTDPKESFSDWTLEVMTKNEDESKRYLFYVHKNFLAAGHKRSEFFARKFAEASKTGATTCSIDIHALAAKSIPQMLDYMYSPDDSLGIKVENAVGLYYLGEFFDITRLKYEAKKFCLKHMSSSTCGTYYEHASILKVAKVRKIAANACVERIMKIDCESRLLYYPDPQFWLELVETTQMVSTVCRHVSTLVAAYCRMHSVKPDVFRELTTEKHLPEVHVEAALFLLDAERRILAPESGSITNLQERCLRSILEEWDVFEVLLEEEEAVMLLERQNPFLLTKILSFSLSGAKQSYDAIKAENDTMQNDLGNVQNTCTSWKRKCERLEKEVRSFASSLKKSDRVSLGETSTNTMSSHRMAT